MIIVAHVIIGLGRGGAERALFKIVQSQRPNFECQHIVISLTNMGCYGNLLQNLGITVHTLQMQSFSSIPKSFLSLILLLKKIRPDIVHTWMYHADLMGGVAARIAGCATVLWSIRSYDLKLGGKISTRIIQRLCAYSSSLIPTLILCVAESSKKLHADIGYDASRIRVIPNGFDVLQSNIPLNEASKFRASIGLDDADIVIGCIGRFHPAKDHHNFVKAASILSKNHPNIKYIMVGPGIDFNNTILNSWIAGTGLQEHFILLGEREDIPVCLSAMNIFCSPSKSEAFPQVVAEAMLVGCPSVVTNVGDTAHLVKDTAVVVEPQCAVALAKGIEFVLGNSKEWRLSMAARAKERVCSNFSLEQSINKTYDAYAEALQSRNI